MQPFDFPTLGLLLSVAALVAMISRRLGVPYSVGLVVAGMALAIFPTGVAYKLTPDLVYQVFLPPLVFEAAIQIAWRPFRRELPLLVALVTLGVGIAATVVAAGMHVLAGWSWLGAAFFGVLLAATDPVAVIALFRSTRVPRRLHLLVESESLLNDGVAGVAFSVLMMIASGAQPSMASIGSNLATSVVGGVGTGVLLAFLLSAVAGRTTDRLVEVTITTLIAYGSFLLAEHFHFSGILAALSAGLVVGNFGFRGSISEQGHRSVRNFWEYVAFLVNSIIFILIGAREAEFSFLPVLGIAAAAAMLSIVSRAASIYPIAALFKRSGLRVPPSYMHALVWGGLRGALALALALALPPLPERSAIITAAFAVVAMSIILQGTTMPLLVRKLGLVREGNGDDDDEDEDRENS